MRFRTLVTAVVLSALVAMTSGATAPARAGAAPTSFSFGAAGDFGANANSSATFNTLAGAGTDFFLALGDLSYSQVAPESAWCDFVTSRVGAAYPFVVVAGNHETAASTDGQIGNFAACLPDRLGAVGSYGQQYYFDYPPVQPLARFIMISPNLAFPGESTYSYTVGSTRYRWLSDAIDEARAGGIRWVIVGMHEVCITAGTASCQITAGLMNLLVAKKVDLVLQGHDHGYECSKQLALGASCAAVPVGSYQAGCVVDDGSDDAYAKGAGTVFVIAATGGDGLVAMNPNDAEAPYFAKLMGSNMDPTAGLMKYTVSATQLSAQFVRSALGDFTDSFTISGSAANQKPVASDVSATSAGDPVAVTLRGNDVETCEVTFSILTGPTNGTLSPLTDQPCVAGKPNQDSAVVTYTPTAGFTGTDSFTYQVNDGTADSNTATVTVSPAGGTTTTTTSPTTTTTSTTTTTTSTTTTSTTTTTRPTTTSSTTTTRPTTTSSTTTTRPSTTTTTSPPATDGGDASRASIPPARSGYWMATADGQVHAFGDAKAYGDPHDTLGAARVVHLEPTPDGLGYWILDNQGRVHAYGDATPLGDVNRAGLAAGEEPTSLSATPTGAGYWIFTSRGRALTFGDATFYGDMSNTILNGPVLGSVATSSGHGYYMVAADGGIFTFGDARFYGSTGNLRLNKPVMGMAPAAGGGYWLVASDGGIFAFDVPFHGSMGATHLNKPITGIVPGRDGYLMVAQDGGIFAFGDVAFRGSLGGNPPASPIISAALLH